MTIPFITITKQAARSIARRPYAPWLPSAFEFAEAAGHFVPWVDLGNGAKGKSADDDTHRLHRVGVARAKAIHGRYANFCHHMREVRHAWRRDETTRTFYADNSIEIDEVSSLTGERRRVMLDGPHGDVCF